MKKRRYYSSLKKKYNLTIEEYLQRHDSQGGACAICGVAEKEQTRKLAVDHCHKTGVIRGLLCGLCNRGLGAFRDDPALLTIAIQYLMANEIVRLVAANSVPIANKELIS